MPEGVTANEARSVSLPKWIDDAAKVTLIILFILYAVGFIIWHRHLARFGIAPNRFLQIEFLSAAICYSTVIFCLAGPAALLFHSLLRPTPTEQELKTTLPWMAFLWIWYTVITRMTSLFFPGESQTTLPTKIVLVAGIAHFIVVLLLRWRRKTGSVYENLARFEWFGIYIVALSIVDLFSSPSADKSFLFNALLLYYAATVAFGFDLRQFWSSLPLTLKSFAAIGVALMLVTNISSFATRQFHLIPKTVGGGKPEVASLVLKADDELLGILSTTHETEQIYGPLPKLTFQTYGPVCVLMRTADELFIVSTNALYTKKPSEGATRIALDRVMAIHFAPND